MRDLCHRCGDDLPSGEAAATFCPHCGAPQLFLSEDYLADPASGDTTGTLPPPLPRQVDWQAALTSAAIVASIAAVLSLLALRLPGMSFLCTVWVLTASMSTLALYQRRRPLAWMDAAVGARIGLASGLAMIAFLAVSFAIAGIVARFGLHAMAAFDLNLAQTLTQGKAAAASAATPLPPEALRLYEVPEFQAGFMLLAMSIVAAFLLIFSTCGGALGGLLRTRRGVRA